MSRLSKSEREQKKEIDSMYGKIYEYREKEYSDRLNKEISNGTYKDVAEAIKEVPMPSFACIIRQQFTNKSISKASYAEKIVAFRNLVNDVLEVTPEVFYNLYSTSNNRKLAIYSLIDSIVADAPDYVKIRACFDTKRILFECVYPELDFPDMKKDKKSKDKDEEEDKISSHDIFYCDDQLKAGLCRAGNTERAATLKNAQVYGKEVDEILMKSIEDILFKEQDFETINEVFNFLAHESATYYDKSLQSPGSKPAGINTVVEKRGYPCLLDYYYLKNDKKFQEMYCNEFYAYREQIKDKVPWNDILKNATEYRMKKFPKIIDLTERLFWLRLNDNETNISGYLLTESQLKDETMLDIGAFDEKDVTYTSSYSCSKEYTVSELYTPGQVKNALTWKDFNYETDITDKKPGKRYPAYVNKDLRLSCNVTAETGKTEMILPLSKEPNPTIKKYMDMFGLNKEDMVCPYSATDHVKIELLNKLLSGELTKDTYEMTIAKYQLEEYMTQDEDEELDK